MNVRAESPNEEFSAEIEDILSDYDISYSSGEIESFSFADIFGIVRESVISGLSAPFRMFSVLITVIIFTSVMKSVNTVQNENIFNLVSVISAVTVVSPQLIAVYSETKDAIERGGGFMLVFVPVFTGITVACGGIASGSVYNIMILGASEFIVRLSESFLMPLLSVTAVLSVTGSVFPQNSVNGIVSLLKKTITMGISITMSLFIGFVTLKCSIAGRTDGLTAKTAKFLISGTVPIIGGAVSDAYSTVRGSFDIIQGTVGTVGVFAVFLILLIPVFRLMAFRLVMWICSAVSDLFSSETVSALLKGFDSGLAIAQSVLVCHALIFILCSAILMQTVQR